MMHLRLFTLAALAIAAALVAPTRAQQVAAPPPAVVKEPPAYRLLPDTASAYT